MQRTEIKTLPVVGKDKASSWLQRLLRMIDNPRFVEDWGLETGWETSFDTNFIATFGAEQIPLDFPVITANPPKSKPKSFEMIEAGREMLIRQALRYAADSYDVQIVQRHIDAKSIKDLSHDGNSVTHVVFNEGIQNGKTILQVWRITRTA